MSQPNDPTVAVLAQLLPGSAGGIEVNLLGLLRALDRAGSGRQIVIGPGGESPWLRPHLGDRQTLLAWEPIRPVGGPAPAPPGGWSMLRRALDRQRFRLADAVRRLWQLRDQPTPREGEGLTETLVAQGAEVVHFPYQRHFATALPSLFEPWDLQHCHYPEFFAPDEISLRDEMYETGCRRAAVVITASEWTKWDLVRQYGLPAAKIAVIPRGVTPRPAPGAAEQAAVARRLGLPERYIVYPAKTWPHKNHARLFEALAHLGRSDGLTVPLVCTGKPVAQHWPSVERRLTGLGLADRVVFTGHLSEDDVRAVLARSTFLVFPSLFEGLGIPLLEAMQLGVPIVTSEVTCLPEIAGDAAIYFDATSVSAIADAVRAAWRDPARREELRARGLGRTKLFDWDDAASKFRVCYQYAAGRRLTPNETAVLASLTGAGNPSAAG
ncbi:MAG: glycosyltransferase family 4 protein [Candidatus Rokuibacteriota bacterium]